MVIRLTDSAVVIAAISAFLYCSSTAYTYGYFGALGLDGSVLDRNFHQILYHGMILNIKTAIWIPLLFALTVTVSSVFKIELSNYVNNSFSNGRNLRNLKKALCLPVKRKRRFVAVHSNKISTAWTVFGFVFAVLVCFLFFESQGDEAAIKVKESIKDGSFEVVRLGKDGNGGKLAYLYCGSRNCAGYDQKRQEVVYFPQSGHRYIQADSM